MTVIAHLSDPHLDTTPLRLHRFEAALAAASSMPGLDAVVVSGDLADHGADEEYAQLFAALPADIPTLVVPGNHDDSEAMLRSQARAGREPALSAAIDVAGVRLVGLDSHLDSRVEGRLSPETLDFARHAALAADGPVVLVMHHPPVPVGHDVADDWNLQNLPDLEALIAEQPRIIGVFTGHVHTALAATFAGVPVLGAPGIVSTMRLGSRVNPIADSRAMPGVALHVVDGTRIRTVFHYLSPAEL